MLSGWLDAQMVAWITLTAGFEVVIDWEIDVVTSHARRLEGSADLHWIALPVSKRIRIRGCDGRVPASIPTGHPDINYSMI